ncbi:hypothetical protein ACRARG_11095 [Pseudooceanicola sp. C21-150M6]|uniref:hypothetical protein n=1 Tax=Pseudooceanicola sp. C21-150M6 TaxID=3434355 RepID=UPI003D7F6A6D
MIRSALLALMLASPVLADAPKIVDATAKKSGMGWRISVTILHPGESWDHYADGWSVVDMAGNELGYRTLVHPHPNEQPFTRSLSSVMIPDGTRKVRIRAHCSRDGWAEDEFKLYLERK